MNTQEGNKQNSKKQEVKKAGVGGAAAGAALAGAATMVYDKTSGQNFAQVETADGHIVGIWADTDNNGIYDTEFVRATPIEEEVEAQTEEVVQAETVTQSEQGQTFSEAFADARAELGAGGVFEWNGQEYNTFYAEEWQNMNEAQHNEWAALPIDEKLDYYDNIDQIDEMGDDNLLAEEEFESSEDTYEADEIEDDNLLAEGQLEGSEDTYEADDDTYEDDEFNNDDDTCDWELV